MMVFPGFATVCSRHRCHRRHDDLARAGKPEIIDSTSTVLVRAGVETPPEGRVLKIATVGLRATLNYDR